MLVWSGFFLLIFLCGIGWLLICLNMDGGVLVLMVVVNMLVVCLIRFELLGFLDILGFLVFWVVLDFLEELINDLMGCSNLVGLGMEFVSNGGWVFVGLLIVVMMNFLVCGLRFGLIVDRGGVIIVVFVVSLFVLIDMVLLVGKIFFEVYVVMYLLSFVLLCLWLLCWSLELVEFVLGMVKFVIMVKVSGYVVIVLRSFIVKEFWVD